MIYSIIMKGKETTTKTKSRQIQFHSSVGDKIWRKKFNYIISCQPFLMGLSLKFNFSIVWGEMNVKAKAQTRDFLWT